MERQIITIKPESRIILETIPGDLRVRGGEQAELSAKTDGETLNVTVEGDVVRVVCDSDLILSVPEQVSVEVANKVKGDFNARGVNGSISVKEIEGNASLSHVAALSIVAIKADLVLRHAAGSVKVDAVGGDASLRHVQGDVNLTGVGADLYLRDVRGNILATAGEDVVAYLEPQADASYNLTAGADIILRLPNDLDLSLTATAGSRDGIRIGQSDMAEETFTGSHSAIFGNGSASATLTAGRHVLVTNRVEEWQERVDFDADDGSFVWDRMANIGVEIGNRMANLGVEIGNRAAERAANINIRTDRVRERAEAAARRAELKAEAAMRRAEQKMRQTEQQMHTLDQRSRRWGVESGPGRPVPPNVPKAPVAEEERLAILRMLADKKISAKDAEQLLAALEGGK